MNVTKHQNCALNIGLKFGFGLRLLLVGCLVSLHAVVCASYFSGQDLSIKSKGRLEKKISAWQSCAILHTEPQQSCLTACLRLRLASSIRCQ